MSVMSPRSKFILAVILLLTFLTRIPTFFEPWWYGDEGISGAVAQVINSGGLLYADVFDNKPPATYLFFALSLKLFGPSLGAIHLLTAAVVIISQIGIWSLARKINEAAGLGAAALLGLFLATPLLEGNSTNGEILMIAPIIWGFVLGWEALKKEALGPRDKGLLTLAGLFFGAGMMFKFPGVLDFAAFLSLLLVGLGSFKVKAGKMFWAVAGFVVPYLAGAAYFLSQGHLSSYLGSTFLGNVGYVGFGNYFLVPQGLLIVKAVPVILLTIFALKRRDLVIRHPLFWAGLIWLGFATYGALLGGRSYNHYFIQVMPALSLSLAGLIWSQFKYRRFALVLTGVMLIFLTLSFARTAYLGPGYYQNLLSYLTGQTSDQKYRNNFDRNTDRDYKVAEYLKVNSTPADRVLNWSNSAQIYVLSERLPASRYVAAYLAVRIAGDEQEAVRGASLYKPKFVVVAPSEPLPASLVEIINRDYRVDIVVSDATIYRRR